MQCNLPSKLRISIRSNELSTSFNCSPRGTLRPFSGLSPSVSVFPRLQRTSWTRCLFVIFPPAHRKLVDLEQRCHVLLPQSEFVSSLLEMAAHRLRIGGVGLGISGFQRDFAEWQQGNASLKIPKY